MKIPKNYIYFTGICVLSIIAFLNILFYYHNTLSNNNNTNKNNKLNNYLLSKDNIKQTKFQEKYRNFILNDLLSSGEDFLSNEELLNLLFTTPSQYKSLQKTVYSKIKYHNTFIIDDKQNDLSRASFMLENVCVNHKGELLFFTTNELYDNWLGRLFERPVGSVQAWRAGDRGGIKLTFLKKEIPKRQIDGTEIKWYTTPTLMMVRYAVGNVGHVISDNLIAMYETIKKFNYNPNDVSIFYLDEIHYPEEETDPTCKNKLTAQIYVPYFGHICSYELAAYKYSKKDSIKYSLQFTQLLSKKPILQRCSYKTNFNDTIFKIEKAPCPIDNDFSNEKRPLTIDIPNYLTRELFNDKIQVCFKKLFFGVGDKTMILHQELTKFRELGAQGFRKHMLKNLNLEKNIKKVNYKKRIRIGIHEKSIKGRHGNLIFNIKDLSKHLASLDWNSVFPQVEKVEVIPIVLENLNIIEQIELFSTINIYISTVGSGSVYSIFMPDDSYLIYTPECQGDVSGFKLVKGEQTITRKFTCKHPVIHFHSNLVHLTVLDASPHVMSCNYRDEFICDPVLNIDGIRNEIIKAIQMKLLNE
ncbi:hypothetical protein ABK040_012624 [Willaertia magna]